MSEEAKPKAVDSNTLAKPRVKQLQKTAQPEALNHYHNFAFSPLSYDPEKQCYSHVLTGAEASNCPRKDMTGIKSLNLSVSPAPLVSVKIFEPTPFVMRGISTADYKPCYPEKKLTEEHFNQTFKVIKNLEAIVT